MLRVVPARTPDHERDEPREKRHEDEHGARHPFDQGRAGRRLEVAFLLLEPLHLLRRIVRLHSDRDRQNQLGARAATAK